MQTYENRRTYTPAHHPKSEKWKSQADRIYEVLMSKPSTRLQASSIAGVPIQNVCRFVAELRKSGKVCVVKRDIDPISKMLAEYISVDPKFCQPCSEGGQLTMFN